MNLVNLINRCFYFVPYKTMTTKTILKKLKQIANSPTDSIQKQVALEALKQEDPITFFSDLASYGCVS